MTAIKELYVSVYGLLMRGDTPVLFLDETITSREMFKRLAIGNTNLVYLYGNNYAEIIQKVIKDVLNIRQLRLLEIMAPVPEMVHSAQEELKKYFAQDIPSIELDKLQKVANVLHELDIYELARSSSWVESDELSALYDYIFHYKTV